MSLCHGVEGCPHGLQVIVGAMERGPVCGCGFHDGANVGQVPHQALATAAFHLPADDVRVEQVPVLALSDEGTALLARVDQALAGQHLHGLAHDGQADVQFRTESADVEDRALGHVTADDASAEGMHDLPVHTSAGVGRRLGFS